MQLVANAEARLYQAIEDGELNAQYRYFAELHAGIDGLELPYEGN